jgi:hypothetical protein
MAGNMHKRTKTIRTGAGIPLLEERDTVFPLQWGRDNPLHFPVPLPSPSNPKGYGSLLQGWRGSRRRNHLSRADARNSEGTEGGRGREAGACRGAAVDVAGVPAAAPQPRLRRREDEPRRRTHTSRGHESAAARAGERGLRRPPPQSASAPRLRRRGRGAPPCRPPPRQGARFGGWAPQLVVLHRAASRGGAEGAGPASSTTRPDSASSTVRRRGEVDPAPERDRRGVVEKRADGRARPHRGAGAGASSPWRSRGSGEGAPEGSTGGGPPPGARQIRRHREEGGGPRRRRWSPARSAAGVVDCLAGRQRE